MAQKNNKYYVTTPIYYVNSKPHLGTLYSTLLADVAARFARILGKEVFFLTGTDEHGQKIQERAAEQNMDPKAFTDSMIPPFKDVWKLFGLDYNKFIRTTDDDHKKAVVKWIKQMLKQGDIYKSDYIGSYCVPCETFVTVTSDTPRNADKKPLCPSCQRDLREIAEESYFFRLSAYQDQLLEFYEKHSDFIVPKERMAEVKSFVKSGLKDISISRKTCKWGIPFPGDPEHTVYVWGDALNNYISAVGYGKDDAASHALFEKWWPADLHVMAKDILRFHAVYWPAFLMAAGLPLPKKLLVHGYILMGDKKMSKSLGNAIDPVDLAEWYGVEPVRYYLMRQMAVTHDGLFDVKDLEDRITSDLANNLGNLLNRTVSLALNNNLKTVEAPEVWEAASSHLREQCEETYRLYWDAMKACSYHVALAHVWTFIAEVNAFFHAQQPWVLAKNNQELFTEVIAAACHSLYAIGIMLWPVMPKKMEQLLISLGCHWEPDINYDTVLRRNVWDSSFTLSKTDEPLFVRPESRLVKADDVALAHKKSEKKDTKKTENKGETMEEIGIEDFAKCHLIVGMIEQCEPVKGSKKLYKLTVNCGEKHGIRSILSGVAQQMTPEQLIGRQGVCLVNLPPRKMVGEVSQGMLLYAHDESGNFTLATVGSPVDNGSRLT